MSSNPDTTVEAAAASLEVSPILESQRVRRLAIRRAQPLRRVLWICVWLFVFCSILATIHQTVCFLEANRQAERVSEGAYATAQKELEEKYGDAWKPGDLAIDAERQARAQELEEKLGASFQRGLANAYSFNACVFFLGIFVVLILAYSADFLLLLAFGNSIRQEIYLVELINKIDGKNN